MRRNLMNGWTKYVVSSKKQLLSSPIVPVRDSSVETISIIITLSGCVGETGY